MTTSSQTGKPYPAPSIYLLEHRGRRIRPGLYRPFQFVIPGTTDTAFEMVRYIRTGSRFGNPSDSGSNIEVTGWPAGRAFDLEQIPIPCEIAESYWAM